MLYVKQKEITSNFDFNKNIDLQELPGYIKHYILKDETILAAYKTARDHGIFTDKKIVLFDNNNNRAISKQIYTIPYKSISVIDIVFAEDKAELNIYLDSSYPIKLTFIEVKPADKVRLRIIYTCINRIICGQKMSRDDLKRLLKNQF